MPVLSPIQSNPWAGYQSEQSSFEPWGQVSQIFTNLTRGFSKIGRDPGAKSISLGLDVDDKNLVFSLDKGSVGRDLLGAILITSAPRTIGATEPGKFQTSYKLGDLSTTSGRITAYQGPNKILSSRLDTLV
jgi:hypothetical protein